MDASFKLQNIVTFSIKHTKDMEYCGILAETQAQLKLTKPCEWLKGLWFKFVSNVISLYDYNI